MQTDTKYHLHCHDVALARQGMVLFSGVNLTLDAGDLLIVQGANGSGKSSLLKLLAGLLPITQGHVTLEDVPLHTHASFPHHALYIGHQRALYPQISVYDNVAFWANISGNKETIDAALHYFDLEEMRDFPLHLLSEGWKQRVALTRLLTMPKTLWLLDEPTANLDQEAIALLHSLISTRVEQGGVVVMTTHAQVKGERFKTLNINDFKDIPNVACQSDLHNIMGQLHA
jgi:heme exporter protein A